MNEIRIVVTFIYIVAAMLGALALYALWELTSYKTGFFILAIENFTLWMWFWHRVIIKARKELENE